MPVVQNANDNNIKMDFLRQVSSDQRSVKLMPFPLYVK